MKVIKTTNIEISMMTQIEDHMRVRGISFAEFIRRATKHYLEYDKSTCTVSIQDSKPELMEQPIEDTPKVTKPLPTDETPKKPNGNFNWDGLDID